jgi:resolvase-like protein
VITKLDRLGRSLEHLIELSNQLQTKKVELVGFPVANAELSTSIYVHTGHGPADDLRVSTLNDHFRGV